MNKNHVSNCTGFSSSRASWFYRGLCCLGNTENMWGVKWWCSTWQDLSGMATHLTRLYCWLRNRSCTDAAEPTTGAHTSSLEALLSGFLLRELLNQYLIIIIIITWHGNLTLLTTSHVSSHVGTKREVKYHQYHHMMDAASNTNDRQKIQNLGAGVGITIFSTPPLTQIVKWNSPYRLHELGFLNE